MITEGIARIAEGAGDVCVIGSGPVGISLALELASKGHKVVLLESGGPKADDQIQALSDAELVDPSRHDDMRIAVSRQLGGTSNLWGGFCLPYDRVDFVARPGLVDATWPISYDDLLPHYSRAAAYARSGDTVYEAPVQGVMTTDAAFSFDTLERSSSGQKFHVMHRQDLATNPNIEVFLHATVAHLELDERGRVGAIEVVHSETLERRTLGIRQVVVAAGGLESTRLLLDLQARHPQLFGGPDGPLGRYYMGHLIGDIADIEFLSEDLDRAFPYFNDGHGSYVRRRFVPSSEVQLREGILNSALWPIVPPVADPVHGSAILSAIYLALAFDPLAKFLVAEAIRMRHIPDKKVSFGRHLLNLVQGFPSAVAFSSGFLWHRYCTKIRIPGFFVRNRAMRYPLAYHAEQLPQPDSRVWLSKDCDRTGLRKLRIDLRFDRRDAISVVRTHELLEAWLQRTGLGRLHWRHVGYEDRIDAVMALAQHGTHQIGTARMGCDQSSAVVDRDLRTFDVPNLFVASTAVMPTSGQANPTLTAIALAMRLAADWDLLSAA